MCEFVRKKALTAILARAHMSTVPQYTNDTQGHNIPQSTRDGA
jgi:hypothetical protein